MRRIPLSKGFEAIIDDDEILQGDKYHDCKGYAARNIRLPNGKRTTSFLHVEIFEKVLGRSLTEDEDVDHVNLNRYDDRKQNLRLATCPQNCSNQGKRSDNTSGYKGVTWHKVIGKWIAQIASNKKHSHLGTFTDPIEAAKAYDKAAKELHGEFARLNFPEDFS